MPTVATPRPVAGTYSAYYDQYISLIGDQDPMQLMRDQVLDFKALLSEVPFEKEGYRYAEGKWSVKEMVGHLIDTERVFAYRAMCIARGETQHLPSYEENQYAANGRFDSRTLHDLAHEYGAVREATLLLFKNMHPEDMLRQGIANNTPLTPLACLWVIPSHQLHHEKVLHERYGNELFA